MICWEKKGIFLCKVDLRKWPSASSYSEVWNLACGVCIPGQRAGEEFNENRLFFFLFLVVLVDK